jgi:hypothetical protein
LKLSNIFVIHCIKATVYPRYWGSYLITTAAYNTPNWVGVINFMDRFKLLFLHGLLYILFGVSHAQFVLVIGTCMCLESLVTYSYCWAQKQWILLEIPWTKLVSSQTSRSSENSRFSYVFHWLVVSCKFHSICFAKFVRQIWTSFLHDIFM